MNQTESDWNHLVVRVLAKAQDDNVSGSVIVGTFLACAVITARKDGATLENLIQLVKDIWDVTAPQEAGNKPS